MTLFGINFGKPLILSQPTNLLCKEAEKMNTHLAIEKKRYLLEKKLDEDLQMEHDLKLQINQEFEELKHVEVSLEKRLAEKHLQEQLNVEH
jgi:hypothetical protein